MHYPVASAMQRRRRRVLTDEEVARFELSRLTLGTDKPPLRGARDRLHLGRMEQHAPPTKPIPMVRKPIDRAEIAMKPERTGPLHLRLLADRLVEAPDGWASDSDGAQRYVKQLKPWL